MKLFYVTITGSRVRGPDRTYVFYAVAESPECATDKAMNRLVRFHDVSVKSTFAEEVQEGVDSVGVRQD